METKNSIPIIFLLLIVFGFIFESIFFQFHHLIRGKKFKTYHYQFARFLYYLITPLIATYFAISATQNLKLVTIFIIFLFLGTVLEWLAGFAYHMIVGQRLWTYHRYSIGGYTSLFSVPLWGIGGVLFYLLQGLFG